MMENKNVVVLDLETQRSFKDVGKANLQKLKVSVVGLYDYGTNVWRSYEEKDILELEKRLQDRPLIIGFNVRRFDLPVLAPYLFGRIEDFPVLDLLDAVEEERGHRASLDSIAVPTLKKHKSGRGEDALQLYQEKRMEELTRYCLNDVKLTKEIFEFGCREGRIFFTSSWDYKTYEIPVSWKSQAMDLLAQASSREAGFPTSLF